MKAVDNRGIKSLLLKLSGTQGVFLGDISTLGPVTILLLV
jgi:hypothetical protein